MKKFTPFYILLLMFAYSANNVCMELIEKSIKKNSKQSIKKSLEKSARKRVRKAAQRLVGKSSQKKPNVINSRLIQNNDTGLIQSKESLEFDIMFMNRLHGFRHREICAFAINKKYYEMLCNLAPERKKYLISFYWSLESSSSYESHSCPFDNSSLASEGESSEEFGPLYWNKDGSICGRIVTQRITENNPLGNKLKLCYWFLTDGKGDYRESPYLDNFVLPLSGVPKMRFCANGDLCCYGWGKEQADMLWGEKKQLMEYSLSQDGVTCQRKCGLDIGNGDIRSLFSLMSSEILLEAFLNSSVKYQTDTEKVYTLKDARISWSDYYVSDCEYVGDSTIEEELNGLSQELYDAMREHCFRQRKKPIEK